MAEDGVGTALDRREDRALLTGAATFTADDVGPEHHHLAFVRSRFAHARIRSVDTSGAADRAGVVATFTAEDVRQSGVPGLLPAGSSPPAGNEAWHVEHGLTDPDRPLLAADVARYAGEPLAVVVAEDPYAAHEAADRVDVTYDRLPALPGIEDALADDAPGIHDAAPDNVAFVWQSGDESATATALADAAHTVDVELDRHRLLANAMEPRSAIAHTDGDPRLTFERPTQGVHSHQRKLAAMLGLDPAAVRVHTPHVGGSFGNKSKVYPAECLTAWVALALDRPVSWQATRPEMYRSGAHGRAHRSEATLAFDDDGTVRGLSVHSDADVGAFVLGSSPSILTSSFTSVLSGQYRIPAIHCRVRGVFTTTAPVGSYRATSRPRAILLLERLVRKAARRLGLDPAAIRRRNFVPPDAFPYETPLAPTYDSGEYERALERALDAVEYDAFRERQSVLREEGRYLGLGLSCGLDEAGGTRVEHGRVSVARDGTVTATAGTVDNGQSHATTFAQLLVEELGVPAADVAFVQGDTDLLADGTGTSGSRSSMAVGGVFAECVDRIVAEGRRVAADELESDPADVAFEDGRFAVRGAPQRALTLREVAGIAHERDGDGALTAEAATPGTATFPFGTHAAVVEVDPETGAVDLRRYVAVDDCGVQINPDVVEGQIRGGVVQGIGQAMWEAVVYDGTGSLVSGSLQDYAVPKATQVPDLAVETTVTPSPRTSVGQKGIGESGPAAAPAAVANAVADALEPFGVESLQLPLTADRVWRALGEE